ncbi:type II toxin-antitoxin system ParD family antitoxin [Aliirhizobium terrae]|uniref:type II toxin-antitoxin system ParD family antitoxin n=1 Tax=Terrirhizobium terrae TaxID=2926709 RepID=UPI002574A816|nr:type II toxin-antitoxin system ParD family antitoxin [Rhizobium sp. CC-CFT758]WJH39335.1 type II toxin-antitoxin system ParD family antitoxin [Rhizobium sp. CC-CFT758]
MADSANLGKHFDDYVDELVKSGRYETRDDVLKEATRLLELRERRQRELDEALARGLADVEAGRVKPIEEVAARLKAKYQAMRKDRRA